MKELEYIFGLLGHLHHCAPKDGLISGKYIRVFSKCNSSVKRIPCVINFLSLIENV
jgi:nitrous oxide reductase